MGSDWVMEEEVSDEDLDLTGTERCIHAHVQTRVPVLVEVDVVRRGRGFFEIRGRFHGMPLGERSILGVIGSGCDDPRADTEIQGLAERMSEMMLETSFRGAHVAASDLVAAAVASSRTH